MRGGKGARAATNHALILASHDSQDSKVVELFVRDLGRVTAVARNARKSRRRFGAHINPLTLSEVTLRTRPDWELGRLDKAVTVEAFAVLKADLLRMALAMSMAEVVLMLVPQHDHDPSLFALTQRAWKHLNEPKAQVTEELLLLFELRALQSTGFMPDIATLPIPQAARDIVAGWLQGTWAPLPTGQIRRQVARTLEALLSEQSGRPLKSRPFLDEALGLRGS